MRLHLLTLPAVLSLLSVSLNAAPLTGRVTARDSSLAVPGATILAFRLPVDPARGPVIQKASTTADGRYGFADLTPGSYRLCVAEAGYYLDPCDWDVPVSLTVGAAGMSKDLVLDPGVPITLVLDDPKGHSRAALSDSGRPLVSATVSDGAGRLRHFVINGSGPGGLGAVQIVPPGVALQLRVSSRALLLGDQNGVAVDEKGHTVPVVASLASLRAPSSTIRTPFRLRAQPGTVIRLQARGVLPVRVP